MRLRLFHYWRSSSSWRVRWAMHLKGVTPEYVPVNLLNGETESPEHRARNPLGYVPALQNLDRPGEPYLIQSLAIIHWLDETVPEPSLLGGKDPWVRAQVRALAEIINADTQPIQNLTVQELHSDDTDARKKWAQHWIAHGLQAYEKVVAQTAGTYSVGNQISLADLCLIPQLYNAKRFEVPLAAYPTILKIEQACMQTEGYQATQPARFEFKP